MGASSDRRAVHTLSPFPLPFECTAATVLDTRRNAAATVLRCAFRPSSQSAFPPYCSGADSATDVLLENPACPLQWQRSPSQSGHGHQTKVRHMPSLDCANASAQFSPTVLSPPAKK